MKPKDLLQHLEKGDRTMYHLNKKPTEISEIDRLSNRMAQMGNVQLRRGVSAFEFDPAVAQTATWSGNTLTTNTTMDNGLIQAFRQLYK